MTDVRAEPAAIDRYKENMHRIALWFKVRLADALCSDRMGRLLARRLNDRIPFRGIVVDTTSSAFSARVKAQLFWRTYESAECRFVKQYLQGTQFAIELGSSLGVLSTHLASVMQPGGRLLCVEANPELIPTIEATATRIEMETSLDVEVIHAAIVADPGQRNASLRLGDETVGSTIEATQVADSRSVSVPAVTLSRVVRMAGFPEYALVSDIEGAETSFILGDSEALSLCRQMVIELHDVRTVKNQIRTEELLVSLIALGFRLIARRGPVVVLEK